MGCSDVPRPGDFGVLRPRFSLDVRGVPMQRIGDCASVNYIEGAMHEGHRAGREI
jgi:hypothetical protein